MTDQIASGQTATPAEVRPAVSVELQAALAGRGALAERFTHFQNAFHDEGLLPPRLLELCRTRIDALHQQPRRSVLPHDIAESVASGDFTELSATEQQVLALAEQLVIDAHGVSETQIAELVLALGEPATVTLLTAIALFDANVRMQRVLVPLAVVRSRSTSTQDM